MSSFVVIVEDTGVPIKNKRWKSLDLILYLQGKADEYRSYRDRYDRLSVEVSNLNRVILALDRELRGPKPSAERLKSLIKDQVAESGRRILAWD